MRSRLVRPAVAVAALALPCLAAAGLGPAWPAAAGTLHAARPAAAAPTTTRLRASAQRTGYDTEVRFAATVTSAAGTPSGSVTLVDTTTGSLLDSVALRRGAAAFSTAGLAPGQRSIVAVYDGSPSFATSQSAAAALSVRAGDDATADQIDASHDGYQGADALNVTSLAKKWTVTMPGLRGTDLSYPIIADGRIFTSATPDPGKTDSQSTVYALSQGTGHLDWTARVPSLETLAGLAYDGRTLFALNSSGDLTAFDAATGHVLWSAQMPGDEDYFTGAPTAYDGMVYLSGAGYAGTLYAVSEADGIVRWADFMTEGDSGTPAVGGDAVYVSYACQQDYRFSLTGRLGWHHKTGCDGSGGTAPVLHGDLVYAEGDGVTDTPLILSAATGKAAGTFTAQSLPAFGQANMYVLRGGNLVATGPSGGRLRWSFGAGSIVTTPVADHGDVFAGASNGTVYALTPAGHEVWSAVAGQKFATDPYSGLAIGNGLLAAPAGNQLTVFAG